MVHHGSLRYIWWILSKYLFPSKSIDESIGPVLRIPTGPNAGIPFGFADGILSDRNFLKLLNLLAHFVWRTSTSFDGLDNTSKQDNTKHSTKRWVETNTSSIDVKVKYIWNYIKRKHFCRSEPEKASKNFSDFRCVGLANHLSSPNHLPSWSASQRVPQLSNTETSDIYQHRVKVKIQPNRIYIESNSFNILYSLIIFSFNLLLTWNPFVSSNLNSTWGLHRTKMLSR